MSNDPNRSTPDVAYGYTFAAWLAAAGRSDSASEYDLRAAWRAGELPAEYRRPVAAPRMCNSRERGG